MRPPCHRIIESSVFSGMIRVKKKKKFFFFSVFVLELGYVETSRIMCGLQISKPTTDLVWRKVSARDDLNEIIGSKFKIMGNPENES